MGKGSSTAQDNVKKKPTVYLENKSELLVKVGNGQAGGGTERAKQINECMIRFDLTVSDETRSARVGDPVILVPEGTGGVQILAKGNKVASYIGDLTGKLFECMKQGFTYRGEVIAVESGMSSVTIRVIARGKV